MLLYCAFRSNAWQKSHLPSWFFLRLVWLNQLGYRKYFLFWHLWRLTSWFWIFELCGMGGIEWWWRLCWLWGRKIMERRWLMDRENMERWFWWVKKRLGGEGAGLGRGSTWADDSWVSGISWEGGGGSHSCTSLWGQRMKLFIVYPSFTMFSGPGMSRISSSYPSTMVDTSTLQ